LFGKEWRSILSGRTFWLLLLLLCPLVGYSYVQAVILYGEASKSAAQLAEVARNLSPLDGVLVPTFGALYLANTFLFPFVVIRSLAHEKETGSLKLLLQLPCSLATILMAKIAALAAAWVVMTLPCLAAVVLWVTSGGHVAPAELANLLFGHALYGAVVAGFALIAVALAETSATAAIITLAITLGFWVLDFAAAGEGGLLKSASRLSLTTLLRTFEKGIFSLAMGLAGFAAATGSMIVAGILINPKTTVFRKSSLVAATLLAVVGIGVGASGLRSERDVSEDRRNSFAPADASTLGELTQHLKIVVRLAPEDPRYMDFERNILSKLQRAMPDVEVILESQSRTGTFEEASERYGSIVYQYGGKQAETRSTGTGEILPLIYGLAGIERKAMPPAPIYPGYPLQTSTGAVEICFYGVLPALIIAAWVATQGAIALRRASGARGPGEDRSVSTPVKPEES
jgi:ABC-type transport system involved in multi-copper enzyme maturation permease subunit